MRSSYVDNNYDAIFEKITQIFLPQRCVELGVLDGYSTLAIAKGIKKAVKLSQHKSHIYSYDIWDDYEYKHGDIEKVRNLIIDNQVEEYVTLFKKNAFEVHEDYEDHTVCLLHIDISNDGDILNFMVDRWNDKLTYGGMLLFEGGSQERDEVEWMIKYNKKPIKPELETNAILNKDYIYGTYLAFPSLTVAIKKN